MLSLQFRSTCWARSWARDRRSVRRSSRTGTGNDCALPVPERGRGHLLPCRGRVAGRQHDARDVQRGVPGFAGQPLRTTHGGGGLIRATDPLTGWVGQLGTTTYKPLAVCSVVSIIFGSFIPRRGHITASCLLLVLLLSASLSPDTSHLLPPTQSIMSMHKTQV